VSEGINSFTKIILKFPEIYWQLQIAEMNSENHHKKSESNGAFLDNLLETLALAFCRGNASKIIAG
jgi:hypothetical protein